MIVWIILLATSVPVETCPPPCECSATTVNCNNKNITDAQLLQMVFPTKLTGLHLTGNLLTRFPTQHFANTNFTEFYLNENRLTEIPKLDPKTTKILVLDNNRIGGRLSANNISWLCETGNVILLENNLIFDIEASALVNCSDLFMLDLSGNMIRHLKRGTFTYFRNDYTKINLRYNQISEIEAGTFGYNINSLNLNKNNLATFDINWFVQPYTGIRSLNLDQNPIYCSCDLVKNLTRFHPVSVYGSCNKTWGDRFALPISINMLQGSKFDAPVHNCSRCTFVQYYDCANGGSCVDNADTSTFGNCQCKRGYRGQMCTEKDPCYGEYGGYTCSGQRLLLSSFCVVFTFVVYFMG